MDGTADVSSPSSVGRELLAGLLGVGIALLCLLPPLLHLVSGPLGPFIAAFIVTHLFKPSARGRAIIAGVIGVGITSILGGAAVVVSRLDTPPSWFPSSDSLAMILGGVLLYATLLAAAGSAVRARMPAK